jgi:hypothetical protein
MSKLLISILAVFTVLHGAIIRANAQPLSESLVGKTFVNAVPAGFWIGTDRGFFKKYGLEIKIIQFTGNTIGTQALLTGSIPFLMAGPHSFLAARAGGADLVEIATLSPAMPYLMIAHKEIKSPDGLKGKILGVAGIGLTGSYIAAVIGLRNLGLDHPAGNFKRKCRSIRALFVDFVFLVGRCDFWPPYFRFKRRCRCNPSLGIPLERTGLVLSFFFKHLVNDPAQMPS